MTPTRYANAIYVHDDDDSPDGPRVVLSNSSDLYRLDPAEARGLAADLVARADVVDPPPAAPSRPERRIASIDGPPWRARVTYDMRSNGVVLQAVRAWTHGGAEVLAGFEPEAGFTDAPALAMVEVFEGHARQAYEPALGVVLSGELGRAVYEALGQHYGTTVDAQTLRRDLDAERAAHAQTRAELAALGQRMADVAAAAVAKPQVTVWGAEHVDAPPGVGEFGSLATGGPAATRPAVGGG